jgi:thiamine pyrophosphate-dependent acetolactate synthase large subunit-like protein
VLSAAKLPDVFADPFADTADGDPRPVLVVLDDGTADASVREQRSRLATVAQEHRVRVETVSVDAGCAVARYASLLATGTYAAAYLGVGLARKR